MSLPSLAQLIPAGDPTLQTGGQAGVTQGATSQEIIGLDGQNPIRVGKADVPATFEEPAIERSVPVETPTEGLSGCDDAFLTRMVNFIVEKLVKVIDPLQPEPVVAIAETAERFNDTSWFWVDDTGKTAELFAVPSVRDAHPALADATLDYVLRLSPDLIIQRRAAVPELRLVDANPKTFRAYNSFFNLTGDLTRGVVCPSIRFNDNRTRIVAQYSGNMIRFRYRGRRQTVDIEDSIKSWSIVEYANRIVFSHTSAIQGKPLVGTRTHVCDVTYVYTLWRARPTVKVSVALTTVSDATLGDVQVTTAFDQLSQGGAFQTAIVGRDDHFEGHSVSGKARAALTAEQADYLSLFESAVMPGFAIGLHVHLKDGAQLHDIIADGSLPGHFHWVYARYALGKIHGGETRSIVEDRLLTGGGYYSRPEIYGRVMIAAETGTGEVDPSMSYDVGAELNAVAVTILFANRGLYSVSPPTKERLQALKAWYDRHLDLYLAIVRPGEPDDHQRVFVRGLSFVILSLDCMARAYQNGRYRAQLETCVQLLLRLEVPVGGGVEESLFATHAPDDPHPPELDCQSAALLALARAAYWGDTDRRISDAVRRGLRGILPTPRYADEGERKALLYNSIVVRKRVGGTLHDTGYWNFKLGLSLRAFNSIRQIQDLGLLSLDPHTLNHLDLLTEVSRRAIVPSVRRGDGTVEVLTCHRAGETNSETQPWVALGLVPAIEWEILGKPSALASVPVSTSAPPPPPPAPVVVHFNKAAPAIHVDWDCPEPQVVQLMDRVAKTWEGLGESRPHWSVLTSEHFLPAHINATEEEFFATGEHDRYRLFETIRRVGRDPVEFKVAHEYGCGLGRITNHLSERFERVVACDVSRPHLDLARARSARIGRTNIDYRLAKLPEFGMDERFDLWFTIIVLQHNPPPIMAMILRRALTLLRPGGLAVFQIPTYSSHYRFDIEEYLASPVPPSGLELHFLPQSILFKLVREAGCALLEVIEDGLVGDPQCLSNSVVVVK